MTTTIRPTRMNSAFGVSRLCSGSAGTLIVWLAWCLLVPPPCHGATFAFSTYLGGAGYEDAFAVAVDAAGNSYITGGTRSPEDFPLLNPWQAYYGDGTADAFLAKFDPKGQLVFATYFGGHSYDYGNAIALDADGNILIAGETHSTDLPTDDRSFQREYAGGTVFGAGDGFIAQFSPDGSQLLYCSYFGGSGDEKVLSIAVDAAGHVVLTGQTDSADLPLRNALQPDFGGGATDSFITKLDPTLRTLVFSTFLGGSDRDEDQRVAVDPDGYSYVCGQTLSMDFPVTPSAFQTAHGFDLDIGPNWDAFIAKLAPDGSALVSSTYIGGATYDAAFAIAADANGSAYVTGAISTTWPSGTFPLGFQPTPGGGPMDAFVAKLKPDGSNFEWFNYLGGDGEDVGYGLAIDQDENAFVTGNTDSRTFLTYDAPQYMFGGGGEDGFAAKISADGTRFIYFTFLGGSDLEDGLAAAVDREGNLIVVGSSYSHDFPVIAAWQSTNASNPSVDSSYADAYIVKISPTVAVPPLSIVPSGDQLLLAWPSHFPGFILESADASAQPPVWRPVASEPLVIPGQFVVIEPLAGENLYRLIRPPNLPVPPQMEPPAYGPIVAWGFNIFGQSEPPSNGGRAIAVTAGITHSLGLGDDGEVLAWGADGPDQSGWPHYGQSTVPMDLAGVVAIAAGANHSVALEQEGKVVAWGAGGPGQSGTFHQGQSIVPDDLSGVIAIAAGAYHTLALRQDGTVVAWGAGKPDGTNQFDLGQSTVPDGLSGVNAIAAGFGHSLALKQDGTVVAWGSDIYGQSNVPSDLRGVIAIAAGARHSLAIKSDRTIIAWGSDDSGQRTVPADLDNVVAIAAGYYHSLALKADGTVVAWGDNSEGQCTVPRGLKGVTAIAGGAYHSLATTDPRLDIRASGAHLLLAWPDWAVDYRVEQSDDLTTPDSWASVPGQPVVVGANRVFTSHFQPDIQFFRLVSVR